MRVNKYKININDISLSGVSFNIPIKMDFKTVDQAEIIERDFVNVEVEKSINPVVDYEKTRFIPIDNNGVQLETLNYKINLLDSGLFPPITMYSHASFVYNDVKFRKNSFKRSFLSLNFYDSDIPTDQNLMSIMTLYSRLTINDIKPLVSGGLPVDGGGLPNQINQIPIRFILSDPIKFPNGISEGYNIYHFKDSVINSPKELFMRATWNNAKTGESIPLITDGTPQMIDNLVSKLHVKYVLTKSPNGWWYEIDMNYSSPTNITLTSGNQIIDLYQIQAI